MHDFKPIELSDKKTFDDLFSQDPQKTSELTFTNLFMWRLHYRPRWQLWKHCLLVIMEPANHPPFGLPPVGTGDKAEALDVLVKELQAIDSNPRICRAGDELIEKFVDTGRYHVEEDRDNSDYVYLAEDLIRLPGNRYHKKKNHVNKFVKNYQFRYQSLDTELVKSFLKMQEDWCELRDCVEHPDLLAEDRAVYEALTHFPELGFTGGAILIDSRVEAFTFGEPLNGDTAVIHIEKANPEIPGLYATINQQFCNEAWSHVTYINRQQDLGIAGLRKAKESYHPHHMVRKFIVSPK